MLVTFTNASSAPVYVSMLATTIPVSGSVQTHRTQAQLDADQTLKALVAAGTIALAFAEETGDDVPLGPSAPLQGFLSTALPAAASLPLYSSVFCTDTNKPVWTNGTNWLDAAGVIVA
jgi:hypothetical protein